MVWGPDGNLFAGSLFGTVVLAEDSLGNVDPTVFDDSHRSPNIRRAWVGRSRRRPCSGMADFSNLTIGKPGTGYTLQANGSGGLAGTSASFNVDNDQLMVTSQPAGNMSPDTSFSSPVIVTAELPAGPPTATSTAMSA